MNRQQFLTRELVRPGPLGSVVYPTVFLADGMLLRVAMGESVSRYAGRVYTERAANLPSGMVCIARENRFYRGQWEYRDHLGRYMHRMVVCPRYEVVTSDTGEPNVPVSRSRVAADIASVKAVLPVCPFKKGG